MLFHESYKPQYFRSKRINEREIGSNILFIDALKEVQSTGTTGCLNKKPCLSI